jgi:hypothetical protein
MSKNAENKRIENFRLRFGSQLKPQEPALANEFFFAGMSFDGG